MKLRISTIPTDGIDVDFTVPAKELKDGLPEDDRLHEAIQNSLVAHFHADKVASNITLNGTYQLTLTPSCDRCLESFVIPADSQFSLTCVPKNMQVEEDEGVITYSKDEIDLSDIVQGQLYSELPMRFICQAECKGLCPKCGINLNQQTCDCNVKQLH